jgi:hypothetical protein
MISYKINLNYIYGLILLNFHKFSSKFKAIIKYLLNLISLINKYLLF